jgi:AAA+ ATPase superfamily predicted ATPase
LAIARYGHKEAILDAAFKVGGIVEPPYFVGREEDLNALFQGVSDLSQNFLLLAPRRFGKSSLLHNLKLRLDERDDLLVPSVNCLEMTSYADFHRATVSALLTEFERKRRVRGFLEALRISMREKILAAARHVEEIGGSVGDLGKAYLRFREAEIDESVLLREAFRFFRAFSEEQQIHIVFLLDEFQEITSFNGALFKLLKKEMDENRRVRYLFSGSSIRMLSSIFLSQDAPLYLMASRYLMSSLDEATVSSFVSRRFAVAELRISHDAATLMHALTGGIPFYVQKLGIMTVQRANLAELDEVDSDVVQLAFSDMLLELGSEFEARWGSRLTPLQRRIAKALASLGSGSVTDVAQHMGVSRTDISSSLRRLRDTMVVSADESTYTLTDCVFARWLAQM